MKMTQEMADGLKKIIDEMVGRDVEELTIERPVVDFTTDDDEPFRNLHPGPWGHITVKVI